MQRQRQRKRQRQRQTDTDRERGRDRDREKQRQRKTDRHGQRERGRDSDSDREKARRKAEGGRSIITEVGAQQQTNKQTISELTWPSPQGVYSCGKMYVQVPSFSGLLHSMP